MGRKPADFEEGCRQLKKGMWSAREDQVLKDYIKTHGAGKWRKSAKETGLQRSGKSLRLRWLNYLRPGITRGNISQDEEDLIIRMHKLVGNRWSLIAGRIPGRTDNEIKNYWNSTLSKKLAAEAEQKEKEQVVSKKKKPIVEDDGNQHLCTDEVLGGGLWIRTCFDSTDATAPSLGFGVGIDINNSTQPTGDYISCKAALTRNDSLMDLNGGQLEISEFLLQTDFSDFWDDSDRSFMNFEVGGCSTVNHEMPDLWHGYL